MRMLVDMKIQPTVTNKQLKGMIISPFSLQVLDTEKKVQIQKQQQKANQKGKSTHPSTCSVPSSLILVAEEGVLQLSNQSAVFKTVMLSPENRNSIRVHCLSACSVHTNSFQCLHWFLTFSPKIITAWYDFYILVDQVCFSSVKYIHMMISELQGLLPECIVF